MEILSDILRSIRLEGTIFFRSEMHSPWGIEKPDGEYPVFHIALNGVCFLKSSRMRQPLRMGNNDIVLLPYGDAHWVADSPHSKLTSREVSCEAFAEIAQSTTKPMRLLCGLLRFDKGLQHPLMSTLPPYIHITPGSSQYQKWMIQTITLIDQEMGIVDPGAEIVTDRLCEILFIQILRRHSQLTQYPGSFLAAIKDRAVNKALQTIHNRLDEPWTLEALAQKVNVSRSVLARRFNDLVGMPPITYLTAWRMQKAYNLLKDANSSIVGIAADTGYSSVEAFSKAFKRHFGSSPGEIRKN